MGAKQARESCKIDAEGRGYLEHAIEQKNFSARAHDRILKWHDPSRVWLANKTLLAMKSLKRFSSVRLTGGYE